MLLNDIFSLFFIQVNQMQMPSNESGKGILFCKRFIWEEMWSEWDLFGQTLFNIFVHLYSWQITHNLLSGAGTRRWVSAGYSKMSSFKSTSLSEVCIKGPLLPDKMVLSQFAVHHLCIHTLAGCIWELGADSVLSAPTLLLCKSADAPQASHFIHLGLSFLSKNEVFAPDDHSSPFFAVTFCEWMYWTRLNP